MAFGRVPEPDDIIGHVKIESGVIVKNSFQAMLTYRLLNMEGFIKLDDSLNNSFKDHLISLESRK